MLDRAALCSTFIIKINNGVAGMQTQHQIPLALQLQDEMSFANFYAGHNPTLLATLRTMAHGRGAHYLYLWGHSDVGCTHLLHAVCNVASGIGLRSLYLSLAELDHLSLDVFEGLETLNVVCIDDVQSIAGKPDWEEAFFHCYNRMHAEQRRLIVAGNVPPKKLGVQLSDLESRLAAGAVFQVQGLSDEEKLQATIFRAKARGLTLPYDSARFLLRHYLRDMCSLVEVLKKLDESSLVEKRRLTIPFIKEVLNI